MNLRSCIVLTASAFLCTGCQTVYIDRAQPKAVECSRIAEELSVLYEAITHHMTDTHQDRVDAFDSRNPPAWLTFFAAGGKGISGMQPEDPATVTAALAGPTRFVVARNAVGKRMEDLPSSANLLVAENAPAYCTMVGMEVSGHFVQRGEAFE